MAQIRVTNNRATFLTLPTVLDQEIRLVPGGNNVPEEVLAALDQLPEKGGARKVWENWKRLGWVTVATREVSAKETKKPVGPTPPATLVDRTLEAAEALVATQDDPNVLKAWLATEEREEIQELIKARLMGSDTEEE